MIELNNRFIIGLTGPKGSGKDRAWKIIDDYFCNDLKQDWRRVAFADPIKSKICELYNILPQNLEILKRKGNVNIVCDEITFGHTTGRDFVRNIGMLMRGYDDQQFNNYVEKQFVECPNMNFVVTDVRFQNEADLIHKYNGIIIQIDRPFYEYDHHVTESGNIKSDIIIRNDDTIESFSLKVIDVVEKIENDRIKEIFTNLIETMDGTQRNQLQQILDGYKDL